MRNEKQLQLFRRSTRLERDGTEEGLKGYIPTPRGLELLGQLLDALASNDYKAFSVTGPYGSGKSSFAVFLSALFEPQTSSAYEASFSLLKAESLEMARSVQSMRERLGVSESGFVVLKVTAQRAPLLSILREALLSAVDQLAGIEDLQPRVREMLAAERVEELDLVKVLKVICVERPVLLCLDEFGKALEWFSEHRSREGDLYVLQQLIEQSENRKTKPLALITLQHLAFDDYAADAAALRQREWAKIQGRFRDFPFSDSSHTTGFLMTRCLQNLDFDQPANASEVWAQSRPLRLVDQLSFRFEALAPLHPLSAVLLPELCSKYGQHERSLFKFLGSADEGSLPWLVESKALVDGWVMPWHLYDYFLTSAGSTSALPSLAQRWIEIQTRLRDAVGLTGFELEILKTIGLFNLCSSSGAVRANQKLLAWLLESRAPEAYSLEAALEQLSSTGFMTYREQSDEFRIWRGSDFDLGEQVRLLMASYRQEPLDQLLANTLALDPLIATRHSQQFCVVRLFQQCFATSRSDLTGLEARFNDPDGLLVWWVSDSSPEDLKLPAWASTVVLVHMERPADLRQLVSYVHAYQTLLKGKVIPEQDWVARREAQERLAVSLQKLQEKVLPLLQVRIESEAHVLKPSSAVVTVAGHRSSAALLSAVCDQVYGQTPRIPNEMLSRRELTSQGAKARRMLIEAIADRSLEDLCGMTKGYGPERAMFDALVGLHGLQERGKGLCWPAETSNLSPVYACIDSFFRGALQTKRPLSELWAQLKAPPFGLKDGPVPVLLSHYLLLHDDQVGLYEDGRFVPGVDTAVIERLAKSPETFHCSSFALEGLRKTYLRQLLDALLIECPRGVTLLYAVKQVLKQVRQWPGHCRHTQTLSTQAKALRKACLGAKEPDQLMFVHLPRAVGVETLTKVSVEQAVPAIASAMREIGGRFDSLLIEMEEAIGEALNSVGLSVRGDVAPRAVRLKDQILDPRLRALALALADQELEADRDWVQRVGLSLLGRAPSEWIDADVQRFHVALNELAPAFRRLEALHFNHQGDGQAGFKAVRVGITTSEGADHQQVISVPDSQIPALESFVQRMLKEASQAFGDVGPQLVLAQWAQQAIGDASASVDELGERRYALTNKGARGHG
jgi:energy-coupling factor transporter ATP-binding protein EcfA2